MQYYLIPGTMTKCYSKTSGTYLRPRGKPGSQRSNSAVVKRSKMATCSYGLIPVTSIKLAARSFRRQSIQCTGGIKMPVYVMLTCEMSQVTVAAHMILQKVDGSLE
jgi:hypothetical protein